MNTPVLEVTNLSKNFGGLRALNEVDLTINRQEIVALIGPNGAGKTTFFNCITGIYLPTEGTVQLHLPERNGKPASSTTLNGMKPNEITSLGMARTFQNIRLFPTMTVLENVMIGRHCRTSAGIAGAVFQDSRTKAEEQATIDRSYELLREVGLNMHYQDEARNLPYGAQRRLEIARALATDPAVLLLDEPAAGMNPQETLELKSLILHLRKEFDLSILLIEHDMGMVMSLSDRIYVMEYGSWARRRKCARTPASSRRILESPTMLELRNVNTFYGNIQALRDVNIRINEGEIVTLIGANGAGKSTTLMTICGGTPPRSGEVLFRGHPIHTLRPNKIVALGISQVPEGRLIFPDLTVQENLDLGAFLRNDKDNIKKDLDYIFDLFPILAQRRAQTGGTLSGGEQQMLAISRAIMARPTLLLLDEPSLGLAPIIIQQIFSIIEKINADGTTVFLVEQNANQALRIANRAYVMENGRIVMEDSADKLLTDPAVQKAYLGM